MTSVRTQVTLRVLAEASFPPFLPFILLRFSSLGGAITNQFLLLYSLRKRSRASPDSEALRCTPRVRVHRPTQTFTGDALGFPTVLPSVLLQTHIRCKRGTVGFADGYVYCTSNRDSSVRLAVFSFAFVLDLLSPKETEKRERPGVQERRP